MNADYRYAKGDTYKPIDTDSMEEVMQYISNLPTEEEPALFGLHPNSNITFNQNTVKMFRVTLNNIHPKGSSGGAGKSSDQIATDIARSIES
mmetsp:Transcript_13251/g.2065  ORF Transcript_13251/g.2065 Transcript_13251/m.2065 type:complete len:92 (+) Transcript_13251:5954-6229(+)